jgi:hypothetical protein
VGSESVDDFKLAGQAWANCRSHATKMRENNSFSGSQAFGLERPRKKMICRFGVPRVGVLSVGRGCQGND